MKRLLACVVVALLMAGCGSGLAPIPPRNTPSPIVLTTALPDAWTALQQVPLHIPTLSQGEPCPVVPGNQFSYFGYALGKGPLYLVGPGQQGIVALSGSAVFQNGLYNIQVLMIAPPAYAADILARGRQIDGSNSLLFSADGGFSLFDQWKLSPDNADQANGGWWAWSTFLDVSGPGCYGLQIDGAGFSEVIVFQIIQG